MPRPKRPGAPEPKRRSRNGCWPCKARKVKCGEEKPSCANCLRQGETCDYSIRLNWEGRGKKKTTFQVASSRMEIAVSNTPSQLTGEAVQSSQSVVGIAWAGFHGPPAGSNQSVQRAFDSRPLIVASTAAPNNVYYHQPSPNTSSANSYPSPLSGAGFSRDDSSLSQARDSPYPSPSDSAIDSPSASALQTRSGPAPFPYLQNAFSTRPAACHKVDGSGPGHDAKRVKITPQAHRGSEISAVAPSPQRKLGPRELARASGGTMFTFTDSSESSSEEAYPRQRQLTSSSPSMQAQSNRVSVQSLLSHSNTDGGLSETESRLNPGPTISPARVTRSTDTVISYGFDCGRSDLDINRNDDSTALEYNVTAEESACSWGPTTSGSTSSERNTHKRVTAVFTKGGYYARPVAINIPRGLTPLPATLVDNPINLLYFYHFLNHTSKILVPHDCSNNPFANVLPAMALQDTTLLNLLLAYSASHRARLLGHHEPLNRIAHWTHYVFPKLRQALTVPNEKISDTNLATAIMLTSLIIISPSTFEVPIRWEMHLSLARNLFLSRRQLQTKFSTDQVEFFLCRWLGYLDIFGSLSSQQTEEPLLGGNYWSTVALNEPHNSDTNLEIDCFTGFTLECRSLLARLAELVHQCDASDSFTHRPTIPQQQQWTPMSPDILTKAEHLLHDMTTAYSRNVLRRTHHGAPENGDMAALDDAYRLTGIVHVYRRVFRYPQTDQRVVESVSLLVEALDRVSCGGAMEVCALLPLFTAGCETLDMTRRLEIRDRFKGFEGVGMKQIRRARKLMQRSWRDNLPWTALTNGEFLG